MTITYNIFKFFGVEKIELYLQYDADIGILIINQIIVLR